MTLAHVMQALELFSVGLFAGAAMLELIVEHPARMAADRVTARDQMQRVLRRADPLMPGLACGGLLFGLWTFYLNGSRWSLASSILIVGVLVLTVTCILPINRRLLAYGDTVLPMNLRADMRNWFYFHCLRGGGALTAYVLAVHSTGP